MRISESIIHRHWYSPLCFLAYCRISLPDSVFHNALMFMNENALVNLSILSSLIIFIIRTPLMFFSIGEFSIEFCRIMSNGIVATTSNKNQVDTQLYKITVRFSTNSLVRVMLEFLLSISYVRLKLMQMSIMKEVRVKISNYSLVLSSPNTAAQGVYMSIIKIKMNVYRLHDNQNGPYGFISHYFSGESSIGFIYSINYIIFCFSDGLYIHLNLYLTSNSFNSRLLSYILKFKTLSSSLNFSIDDVDFTFKVLLNMIEFISFNFD